MQILILTVILALVNVMSFVNAGNVSKGAENMSEPAIAKILPAEYAAYEQALAGDHGLNDARASIALLSKVKETLGRSLQSHNQEQDSISAYRAAWRLCLRTMRDSKDQAAQKLIVDEWNKSLREDSDATPSQVYALSEQWDRKLLTNDFWQLLRQTNKRKTVSAICYVLYERGNAADAAQLMQKRKSGVDVGLQEGIQNTINYMNYRLSGDTSPGPAAAPPRME